MMILIYGFTGNIVSFYNYIQYVWFKTHHNEKKQKQNILTDIFYKVLNNQN